MTVCAYNTNTQLWEVETKVSQVQDYLGLYGETMFQKKDKRKTQNELKHFPVHLLCKDTAQAPDSHPHSSTRDSEQNYMAVYDHLFSCVVEGT